MAYTPVTTQHAGTQAAINGLLAQLDIEPVQGRMPRTTPLTPLPQNLVPTNIINPGPSIPTPRRAAPLVANRIPVAGPVPAVGGGSGGLIPGLGGATTPAQLLAAEALAGGTGAASGAGAAARSGILGAIKGAGTKFDNLPIFARYNKLGMVGKAGVGIGIGVGGHMLADALGGDDTAQGKFTEGAANWAPWGLIAGPKGAAVAGLVGGVANVLFGDDKKDGGKLEDRVTAFMSEAGMDPEAQSEMMSFYELEKEALGEEAAKANLMTRLGSFEEQSMMAEQAAQQNAVAQQNMLAQQALAGQFFAPFAQQMVTSAQQRHQAIQSMLPSLPESYRGIAASQSAAALDNATRMATAYQAQAQMIPAMSGFQQQSEQINSLAAQLLQQGIQQTLQPQAGGDLMSLLQGAGQ